MLLHRLLRMPAMKSWGKKMREFFYPSCGKGDIHVCRWEPEGEIRGIVQIVHGIAEYAQRYEPFALFLNDLGYLVVAEDHMGHGKSRDSARGYFHGGWFCAVQDTFQLLQMTKEEFPGVPYILFGHSMGSFMARTMLIQYPDCGISGAVICGTGWMPQAVLQAGYSMGKLMCRGGKDRKPNDSLHKLMFGAYNKRVEHPRSSHDWLNRDPAQVDAYVNDPMCGFTETAGLARDMLQGILYIQNKKNLQKMNRELPVLFIAGGDDPVGDYGKGVHKAAEKFKQYGMKSVSSRIYPLCRHEILNEINKEEIFEDIAQWIEEIRSV